MLSNVHLFNIDSRVEHLFSRFPIKFGIKAAIMSPTAKVYDKIDIDAEIKKQINEEGEEETKSEEEQKKPKQIKKQKAIKDKKLEKDSEDIKTIEEFPKLKDEEQGTAMKIEEEIEEGVPQEQIDEDIEIKNPEEIKGSEEVKK